MPDATVSVGPQIDVTDQSGDLPAELLRDVDCLLCELPPTNFHDLRRLKWMQLSSAGYSQIFGLPLIERGIRHERAAFDVPIAEWNLMMLVWHRSLLGMLENQRLHSFDRSAEFQNELRGSTVGFYGYGGLARETARLCKALGINVWA
jgi:phosphoglycerate dehydrogenase-like enzyme